MQHCAKVLGNYLSNTNSLPCSLYNNIKQPGALPAGSDFHLFKSGIEPKWEDPHCAAGGKWTVLVPKGGKQLLDTYWLHAVSCCNAQLPAGSLPLPRATAVQKAA